MRAIFTLSIACVVSASAAHAATVAPATADGAALMQIEAVQDRPSGDRSAERVQSRHHYLYDDEYQPGSETVGAKPSDARACATEPVRTRRPDGTTAVLRLKRCEE